ncbi:Uncharacterised protein [Mycobacterium tuberculosis]|nr:Uncharacterised protein [Mycobacterium tuberculosis]
MRLWNRVRQTNWIDGHSQVDAGHLFQQRFDADLCVAATES